MPACVKDCRNEEHIFFWIMTEDNHKREDVANTHLAIATPLLLSLSRIRYKLRQTVFDRRLKTRALSNRSRLIPIRGFFKFRLRRCMNDNMLYGHVYTFFLPDRYSIASSTVLQEMVFLPAL